MRVTHSDWRSSSDSSRTSVRTPSRSNRRRISVVPSVERWSVATTCVDAEVEVVEQVRLHDVRLVADEQREDDLHRRPDAPDRATHDALEPHGRPGLAALPPGGSRSSSQRWVRITSASPSTAASTANEAVSSVVGRGKRSVSAPVRTVAERVADAGVLLEEAFGQPALDVVRPQREGGEVGVHLAARRRVVLERVVRGPGPRAPRPPKRRTSRPRPPRRVPCARPGPACAAESGGTRSGTNPAGAGAPVSGRHGRPRRARSSARARWTTLRYGRQGLAGSLIGALVRRR